MKLILACDPDGGIGYKNKLPWTKIQGDLPRFKKLTDGQVVVMGRNTWESLPKKPLLGRLNFILTSQNLLLPNGAISVPNLNHFSEYKNAWLIGGASVINSHWHMIDVVHLTRTFTTYTCDTFVDLLKLTREFSLQYEEVNSDHTYEVWAKR
jgi:dihydrofolate reductase